MVEYYDIVLGLIPISLGGLTALFATAGQSLLLSLTIASIATLGLMGHAMFVNAPGHAADSGEKRRSSDTSPNDGPPAHGEYRNRPHIFE